MTTKKISLLHATFESLVSPQLLWRAWLERARFPHRVEILVAYDHKDSISKNALSDCARENCNITPHNVVIVETKSGLEVSTVYNWNKLATLAQGDFLLPIADDTVGQDNWDDVIDTIVADVSSSDTIAWKISDAKCSTFEDDGILPRHPLVTRGYVEKNQLFNSKFQARGADDYFLYTNLFMGDFRDGRKLKIHHSKGRIIGEKFNLMCGCFTQVKGNDSLSRSQARVKSTQLSAQQLVQKETSLLFQIALPLLVSKVYGVFIFKTLEPSNRFQLRPKLIVLGVSLAIRFFLKCKRILIGKV